MWVRANDEINAAINQPTGEFALFVNDSFAVFDPQWTKQTTTFACDRAFVIAGPSFARTDAAAIWLFGVGSTSLIASRAILFPSDREKKRGSQAFLVGVSTPTASISLPSFSAAAVGRCERLSKLIFFPSRAGRADSFFPESFSGPNPTGQL
jgi:hypothetical protein